MWSCLEAHFSLYALPLLQILAICKCRLRMYPCTLDIWFLFWLSDFPLTLVDLQTRLVTFLRGFWAALQDGVSVFSGNVRAFIHVNIDSIVQRWLICVHEKLQELELVLDTACYSAFWCHHRILHVLFVHWGSLAGNIICIVFGSLLREIKTWLLNCFRMVRK